MMVVVVVVMMMMMVMMILMMMITDLRIQGNKQRKDVPTNVLCSAAYIALTLKC